jgi:WD40 repeat protein
MARVFVSHASKDAALAAEVHRWLVADGHEAFLDEDLSDGILAGDQWQQRLHERLRWADATVCVLTSAYLASVWCTAELAIAQARGSRLLPIRAEPGVCHPLLNNVQYANMAKGAVAARAELAEALLRVDAAGGSGWPDDRSPFPGLRALNTDEHSVFFGRSREVDQLAELLRSPAEQAERAVLLVVGPSGCGKSSLVRAGLLPVMAADEDWWTLPAILPGTQPVAALGRELAASAKQVGLSWTVTDVRRRLDDGDLTGLVDDLLLAVPGRRRRHLLLVVDQFEELLIQTWPEERARFAELLCDALAGSLQVVATLRPEFLDQLLASPELAVLPTRTQTLRPLRPEALRAVIEGPADRAGLTIDADLVTRLVADTGGGEALPLLAYTLAQLTKGVTRGGRLSTARYEQLGEVHGVLAGQADAALVDAVSTGGGSRDQVIKELLRLVTVDEQGRPTRWRVRRDELPEQVIAELQPFVDRRLLTTDTEGGHVVFGVAHEAFLIAWLPLGAAIAAAASALRARRQVEQAAERWIEDERAPARLWERGQLAAVLADTGARLQTRSGTRKAAPAGDASNPQRRPPRRWRRRHRTVVADRVELSAHAGDFLAASIRRERRRRGRAVTILSVLLVLALGAAAFAVGQQRAAEEGQRLATARLLVAQAESGLDEDPRTALRLNEAAAHIHPSHETRSALVNNLLSTPYRGTLTGHDLGALAVAFAPNEPLLATAGMEGAVRLWNLTDPVAPTQLGTPLIAHDGAVNAVAFAPNEPLLATAGIDGTVRLWNLTDPTAPTRLGPPLTHDDAVWGVAFAPDKPLLATVGNDGIRLWNLTDPTAATPLGTPLTGPDGGVFAVAFAPNKPLLATAGVGVRLWDLTDPTAPTPLGSPLTQDEAVRKVAFAPNEPLLTAAGSDGIRLWNLTDPTAPTQIGPPLTGPDDPGAAVAFAPDEPLLVGGGNGTVRLWDLTEPTAPTQIGPPLTAHDGGVWDVVFAPNESWLATAGISDGTVLLWSLTDPTAPTQVGTPLTGHDGAVKEVVFAPNEPLLASASFDATMRLWNLTDPTAPTPLGTPFTYDGMVTEMALAPNEPLLVSASHGTVRLWDLTEPTVPTPLGPPLTGPDDPANVVAFAPDRPLLATGGDGTVRLWNLTEPTAPTQIGPPLTAHDGSVTEVAFASDGKTLATAGSDGTVRLWNLTEPTAPTQIGPPLTAHDGSVWDVVFAPNEPLLATAGFNDGTVRLWNLTDPTAPTPLGPPLAGLDGAKNAVAFAPDEPLLVTAGDDGTVRRWDLTDPAAPTPLGPPLTGHDGPISTVAFAPDEPLLATAGDNGMVRLWNLSGLQWLREHAMERACAITGGGLSDDEWANYVQGFEHVNVCRS